MVAAKFIRKLTIMADLSKIILLLFGVYICSVLCQNSSEPEDLANYKLIFAQAVSLVSVHYFQR